MGEQNPVVSVIIPAYNAGQTIDRAIQSVLRQTYRLFEILVIDDDSHDDTAEKVQSYGENVKYIYQSNAGVSAARNNGVQAAAGNWVAFLDADDEWHPKKLAIQMEFVTQIPSLVLITNTPLIIRGNEEKEFGLVSDTPKYTLWQHAAFIRRNKIHTSSAVMAKAAFDAVGGCDTSLTIGEDRDLWLKLLYIGTGICINEPLTKYYHYSNGLSHNPLKRFYCDLALIDRWDHRQAGTLDSAHRIATQEFVKIKYAVLFTMIFKLLRVNQKAEAQQFWHIFYQFHKQEYPYLLCPPFVFFKTLAYLEKMRKRWKYGLQS